MLNELRDDLQTYFAEQPAFGTDPRVVDLTLMTSGWASDVYAFTLQYEEIGETISQRLVLKAYANSIDGKDRALKERHALFNLRSAHYPVPGVAAVETDPYHIGRPFIIMEQVEGRTMMDAIQEADPQQRGELVRLFVGLLTDLHSRGAQVLVPSIKPTSDYLMVTREVYTMRSLAQNWERAEFTPVLDWLYERRTQAPTESPVITHRDFHPWNIILGQNGRPYVIDWGWQVSDPRYDLAWTLTLLERSGYADLRDEVLREYERVIGGPVDQLAYFEVLATTRWLMEVSHSLQTGNALRSDAGPAFRMAMAQPIRNAVDLIETRTGVDLPDAQQFL